MRKKWDLGDYVVLGLEILSPVIAIIITCVVPAGKALDADVRLSIISTGIFIPILLLQISVTQGQNKSESDMQKIDDSISELSKEVSHISFKSDAICTTVNEVSGKVNHISPVLEQVFLSGNDRIQRFAYRRFGEVCKVIQSAVNNNNSGELKPTEYYQELLFLAERISKDKAENKDKFSGEIWAMTSFADEEWIADAGYEKLWTDKLKELTNEGIKTRRLCLIPDSVYRIITQQPFAEPNEKKGSFRGLIELLKSYYSTRARKEVAEHFIIREHDNPDLYKVKGFFAIKLTNGELHILYGETFDANCALTARVLFDSSEIKEVRRLFDLYARPAYKVEKKIPEMVASNGFIEYLQNQGISL